MDIGRGFDSLGNPLGCLERGRTCRHIGHTYREATRQGDINVAAIGIELEANGLPLPYPPSWLGAQPRLHVYGVDAVQAIRTGNPLDSIGKHCAHGAAHGVGAFYY
nr:hypothetical protein NCPCFENI_01242 [Cupriavidus sp.]